MNLKHIVVIILLLPCLAMGRCPFPSERSAPAMPMWMTVGLPPDGRHYYYAMGFGVAETREQALEIASRQVVTNHHNFLGRRFPENITSVPITSRRLDVYWELCWDPVRGGRFFHVYALYVVAKSENRNLERVHPNRRYLRPETQRRGNRR